MLGSTPDHANIAKGTCIAPPGGWQNQTYYVVDIAWRSTNPVFRAILYVGFVPSTLSQRPRFPALAGGYTSIMQTKDDIADNGVLNVQDAYYIKAVSVIPGIGSQDKPPRQPRQWLGKEK